MREIGLHLLWLIMQNNSFFNLISYEKAKLNEKCEQFTENDSRLDDFYYDIIGQDKSYNDLWFVIKLF